MAHQLSRMLRLFDLGQLSHQFFIIRFLAEFVCLGKSDFALLIYDENSSIIDSRQRFSQAQDSILLGCSGMRPIVA